MSMRRRGSSSRRAQLLGGLALACALSLARGARADWNIEGGYLLAGANVGGVSQGGESGLLLGAELSYAQFTGTLHWVGAYVDATYDFGIERARFSLGPELGWSILGFDAGFAIEPGPDRVRTGFGDPSPALLLVRGLLRARGLALGRSSLR